MAARILLLGDTHVGFDHPLVPRVERRRRGPDFLASLALAVEPALRGEVDAVVHLGDVFHMPHPHPTLVAQAFQPLRAVAERGVPVLVVPGNHERSRIPHARFAAHPLLRIFEHPETFTLEAGGLRLAFAGFPYERDVVRRRFPDLTAATGWRSAGADASFLCVHHCFEGAVVGPADFTFRRGPDVVRHRDVPEGIAAVLSGHIHRHQVLTTDLDGRPVASPVVYPGSTERTAFAELGEPKGTVLLELERGAGSGASPSVRWSFRELPARPMVRREVWAAGCDEAALRRRVRDELDAVPEDAVLQLRVTGPLAPGAGAALTAAALRSLTPPAMNLELVVADGPSGFSSRGRRRTPRRTRRSPLQQVLELPTRRASRPSPRS